MFLNRDLQKQKLRMKKQKKINTRIIKKELNQPVSVWTEKERYWNTDRVADCLTVILRTKGCYWDKCLMCGYSNDADKNVTEANLKNQFLNALTKLNEQKILKIFTSGSFFDNREIPHTFREFIYDTVLERGIKKLIIESRPEFIDEKRIEIPPKLKVEVGIGLETSSDFIRENCINKGFTFENFRESARILKLKKIGVKAYLLLKPPFLSEREAIEDVVKSAADIKDYVDVISLNLMNIPSKTYVEDLWRRGLYRPPWLWSAVDVLKSISKMGIEIVSDPVGGGKPRGPHNYNCGKCDKEIIGAIREFSLTQRTEKLEVLHCDCIGMWKKALELEYYSRVPIFS